MKKTFSRKRRLKNAEIKALLKKARKAADENLVLYASKNRFSCYRLAIAIARKVVRLSSKRNLFRRRIKAAVLEIERKAAEPRGYDIFIVVRAGEILSYDLILKKVFGLLKKIKE